MNLRVIAGDLLERVANRLRPRGQLSHAEVANALYRGLLQRDPDMPGLAEKARALLSGRSLEQIVRDFVDSPEFHARFLPSLVPPVHLPDLTAMIPEHFEKQDVFGRQMTVYVARDDADMDLMAELIEKHRFYDRFGVWAAAIDQDKQILAATVRGFGARSCFELGCFTGPVLSLLADSGVEVAGCEVSHLAFVFAYPNVRDKLSYGDLLDQPAGRVFDLLLCLDVLEHINPLRLDAYIARLVTMLAPGGVLYVNSPMWGRDRIFGVVEEMYLDEWRTVGDAACWRHWPCEDDGWPIHGHLVWASPTWWERKFAEHGLARDTLIEETIHRVLAPTFEAAPGRRSLFVLRRAGDRQSTDTDVAEMERSLRSVPGLSSA